MKTDEPSISSIAVVGMAGRFPGAKNVLEFWRNLRSGVESIRFFGREELLRRGIPSDVLAGGDYVPANGFLADVDLFDAEFFGVPPREAELMDPQHRVLLEVAWEALEDAACDPERFDGRIGVYAGIGFGSYLVRNVLPYIVGRPDIDHLQLLIGNGAEFATSRISYKLNLRGPSVSLNTACSSGLVAVHFACQSLLHYECDLALAGGVSIQLPQDTGYLYQRNGIASPDGHCRPFDAKAAGTVHGNGAGLVALKRLEDAVAAGDNILAVILGSAINNDGAAKVGYTAPSIGGQAEVIEDALAMAGCPAESVTYVEAHGTGTPLGDPVEVAGLTQAFHSEKKAWCAIGSVKSNIGHLDEAAGVAGLIKTVLSLQHREIPPSLHFRTPNAEIGIEKTPFFVNGQLRKWDAESPRRAGVSSFGIGGTNVHAVIEEAPAQAGSISARPVQLLTLSARTPSALEETTSRFLRYLEDGAVPLADAAYTLQCGKRAFNERRAILCGDQHEAVTVLREHPSDRFLTGRPGDVSGVVFLFSGQGSQYPKMGKGLYESEPEFRREFDRCAEVLAGLGTDIKAAISGRASEEDLRATAVAQPLLFAFEYSLARLWMSWGVNPKAMAGHSIGEYVAAHLAGVFSLEDALSLVSERGRLVQALPSGVMLSVQLPAAELGNLLNGQVTLALMNGPDLSVVAGSEAAVSDLQARLEVLDIPCQRLATSHAFHSPMMEPAVAPLRRLVERFRPATPKIPFLSNVSGTWIQPSEAIDPGYWARHLRMPVRFDQMLTELGQGNSRLLLEVGPGDTLKRLALRHPALAGKTILNSVRHPKLKDSDELFLTRTLAQLWTEGVPVDWSHYNGGVVRRKVSLPAYPFERQRFWIDPPSAPSPVPQNDIVEGWFYEPRWKETVWPAPSHRKKRWVAFGFDENRLNAIKAAVEVVAASPGDLSYSRALETSAERILFSASSGEIELLRLAKALAGRPLQRAELIVVTEQLYRVDGDESLNPRHALVAGAARVIGLEMPITVRCVDVRPGDDTWVQELKIAAADANVAVRRGRRFVRTFEPAEIPSADPKNVLRPQGVYLITGGLGSMGMAFARFLAENARAKLVLVSRSSSSSTQRTATGFTSESLKSHAREIERELAIRPFTDYAGVQENLNKLCVAVTGDYLRTAVELSPGSRFRKGELLQKLKVSPRFHRFFDQLLRMLTDDGYLRSDGEELEVLQSPPSPDAVTVPGSELHGAVRLLKHCAESYPRALSGEIEAIEVLYPDGTPQLLSDTASENVEYSYGRVGLRLVADLVRSMAEKNGSISVLEVGGGNGDLTYYVIEALGDLPASYLFTDVSSAFVRAAERRSAEKKLERMHFGLFDITRPADDQGFKGQKFDLILAYNVLHIAPDIQAALTNLRGLLKEEGVLALVETMSLSRWDLMCWGLAEQLWGYADGRQDSPFLNLEQWVSAFRSSGFSSPVAVPCGGPDGDCGVIVAHAGPGKDQRSFEAIERLGGEVMVCQADVTDRGQMSSVIAEARRRFGRIDGVIHTAGVLGQGLIRNKTAEDVASVLRPKVAGVQVLSELLAGDSLDFFILCSAGAGIAPILGQFDYAAANAYLDAFAHYRSSLGLPCVSVNWDFWQELGMIERAHLPESAKRAIEAEISERGLSNAGVLAFSRIITGFRGPQVVVSPVDFNETVRLRSPKGAVEHSLLGKRIESQSPHTVFSAALSVRDHWVLNDHRPFGRSVLPGTAYIEMATAAFAGLTGEEAAEITDLVFLTPLEVEETEARETRTTLSPENGAHRFHVVSRAAGDGDAWIEHATGIIAPLQGRSAAAGWVADGGVQTTIDFSSDRSHPLVVRQQEFPLRWQCLRRISHGESGVRAELGLPGAIAGEADDFRLHPSLLDMAVGVMALKREFESGLPFSYERIRIWRPLSSECIAECRLHGPQNPDALSVDMRILDAGGSVCLEIDNYVMRRIRTPHVASRQTDTPSENFRVEMDSTGALGRLAFRPVARRAPGPGEIEIEVAAAGLNFIEVLFALGMLSRFERASPANFGLELSGHVSRLGQGVKHFRIGDPVVAFCESSFTRFAIAAARAVARKPDRLSMIEAATIPAAFCTAYYALVTRGGLKRGERVLIHSAAGGVGLAAVQIARWIGAEIFATAGNEDKRKRLRDLGVPHVMDSRTLEFKNEIATITSGRGVDVALNSLSGEFLKQTLETLAPWGRFLEIGKRDIFGSSSLPLAPFAKRLAFIAIDVGTDLPEFEQLWNDVIEHVKAGHFGPLPHTLFPVAEIAEAFEYMAQARHFGKIVIDVTGGYGVRTDEAPVLLRNVSPVGRSFDDFLGIKDRHPSPPQPSEQKAPDRFHERPKLGSPFREPATESEKTIARIWRDLLGIDPVGADDNFFELRGDSLLAAQVTSRIYRDLGVKLPLSVIFDHQTVSGLADHIASLNSLRAAAGRNMAEEEEGVL